MLQVQAKHSTSLSAEVLVQKHSISTVLHDQSADCHERMFPSAGPNTLVGLAKPADAASPFDHDAAIKALLPAYTQLLQELKGMGVPEAQLHEPILATTDAAKLKAEFTSSYGELSKVGLPINMVSPSLPHPCTTL